MDPELRAIIDTWPTLPGSHRAAMLALVNSHRKGE